MSQGCDNSHLLCTCTDTYDEIVCGKMVYEGLIVISAWALTLFIQQDWAMREP